MSKFQENGGVNAYTAMYLEILEIYAPSFLTALKCIHDARGPVLFHCTAGKDRTSVLASLLLSLAGAPTSLIAYDYTLTRVGVEPNREMLLQMLKLWNKEWTAETPGMSEFVQVRGKFMLGFLDAVQEKWGGVEGYVVEVLGIGKEGVERMRGVLRGEVGREEGEIRDD